MSERSWPRGSATAVDWANRVNLAEELIARIQMALGTEETGDALVQVALRAHSAERTLAAITGFRVEFP